MQRFGRASSFACFAIALVTVLLSGVLGQARWQMAPAYVLLIVLFMKWLGLNGTIDAERAIEIVNSVTLRFFDTYLRGRDEVRFDGNEFPELRFEMNERARR